jgi:glycerol-3-phosphate dehydrogenase (NAD(P)+)
VRIAVIGAGAWGTALACSLATRRPHGGAPAPDVTLWTRRADHADELRRLRTNEKYLPGIALPSSLHITDRLDEAVRRAHGGLLAVAVPTAALRPTLRALRACQPLPPLLWLCKGFERDSGSLPHEIVAAELPGHLAGPLSGPSFATEVAQGLPTALLVAGAAELCAVATRALHGDALRLYSSQDVVGVEVGGAVKNVMAIGTGIADALGLGNNARAALITRGLAETRRLGVALGGRPETFTGLAGLGDLILTCTGELSRNRRVGLALGRGVPLDRALADLGHVAEGVWSAPATAARAQHQGVEMPITQAVCAVLDGRLAPSAALDLLLARGPRSEGE